MLTNRLHPQRLTLALGTSQNLLEIKATFAKPVRTLSFHWLVENAQSTVAFELLGRSFVTVDYNACDLETLGFFCGLQRLHPPGAKMSMMLLLDVRLTNKYQGFSHRIAA